MQVTSYVEIYANQDLRIAFSEYGGNWNYIDLGFDLLFALDLVLRFFTGATIKGEISYNRKDIALSYLK